MAEHNDTAPTAPAATSEQDPRLHRLVFLTDGVYAIALTLLAVELGLPEVTEHLHGRELLESLLETWPELLGYLTSFTVIALAWQANDQMFRHVRRFDGRLLWLTFVQLLCIAFVPFLTSVLGEHIGDPVAQEFYFASLLMTALSNTALWWYATSGHRLVGPDLSPRVIRHRHLLSLSALLAYLILMGLVVLGVGRIVNPVLLAYLLFLGYIAAAVFGWWEPRPEIPESQKGPEDKKEQAESESSRPAYGEGAMATRTGEQRDHRAKNVGV